MGRNSKGDLTGFTSLGIKVDRSRDITFMKAPISGSEGWLREFAEEKMVEIRKVMEGIRKLRRKHVGLYLLRNAANVRKIMYLVRATPRDMLEHLLREFDAELRGAFEEVVGLALTDEQWGQPTLPISKGGWD